MNKEQQFFKDPAIDRIMGMLMALATEVYILRDRSRALEEVLNQRGVLSKDEVENLHPTPERRSALASDRDAFVRRVFDSILRGEKADSTVDRDMVDKLTAGLHAIKASAKA